MDTSTWWIAGVVLVGGAVALVLAVARMRGARRRRSGQWNDLRQRRQLFETQLRELEDVQKGRLPEKP